MNTNAIVVTTTSTEAIAWLIIATITDTGLHPIVHQDGQ
jgi:hypothetical protein